MTKKIQTILLTSSVLLSLVGPGLVLGHHQDCTDYKALGYLNESSCNSHDILKNVGESRNDVWESGSSVVEVPCVVRRASGIMSRLFGGALNPVTFMWGIKKGPIVCNVGKLVQNPDGTWACRRSPMGPNAGLDDLYRGKKIKIPPAKVCMGRTGEVPCPKPYI